MFFTYLLLAISVSIDSLGIGITYGLRNTKIPFVSKIILFTISVIITGISLLIGNIIVQFLPINIAVLIGSVLLVLMGIFIIYQAFNLNENKVYKKEKKVYQFFINFLGITIQIIRNPISSDLDKSKIIDYKEALYLGFALSIDSVCIGITSSIIGLSSFVFPFIIAIFQIAFLTFGKFLGEKLHNINNLPDNIWNIIAGIILIIIGICKFFFV